MDMESKRMKEVYLLRSEVLWKPQAQYITYLNGNQ